MSTSDSTGKKGQVTLDGKPVNIAIALVTMRTLEADTVRDIIALTSSGLVKSYSITVGTLLPYARNEVLSRIYQNVPDFTHCLMIDADQSGFTAEHLKKMLSYNVDIISGVTCFRNKGFEGQKHLTFVPKPDTKFSLEQPILEISHTGLFFSLIKREVLDALMEEVVTPEGRGVLWFTNDRRPRPTWEEEREEHLDDQVEKFNLGRDIRSLLTESIQFGRDANLNTAYTGEDIAFCQRVIEKGFKIYVDLSIKIGHIGSHTFVPEFNIQDMSNDAIKNDRES
jgi:hypothetical protein